jgi:photosystem II stability/assembly factor-like uncharacterized protein
MKKEQLLIASAFVVCLFLWAPAEAQWSSLGSGIVDSPRTVFSLHAVDYQTIWATSFISTQEPAYNFTVSVDGGTTWQAGVLPVTMGDYFPIAIRGLDGNKAWVIMAGTLSQDLVKLFHTDDGGQSWVEQTGEFSLPGIAFASIHLFSPHEGVCFGSPGSGDSTIDSLRIYRTADGGLTWVRIPQQSMPVPLANEGVWIYGNNNYSHSGDTLWFCTRAGRVFRTVDRGQTWQAFSPAIGQISSLTSVAFKNASEGILLAIYPNKAAKTEDGGETWTEISIPTSPVAADIQYIPGTDATYLIHRGYLNTGNQINLMLTTNGGDTWSSKSFTPGLITTQFISSHIGYGGGKVISPSEGGIYKWIGDWITAIERPETADDLVLYPNPSNGNFRMQYNGDRHPRQAFLYNNAGEQVRIKILTVGLAQYEFNTTGLSAGTYIFLLLFDNGESTVKYIVVN